MTNDDDDDGDDGLIAIRVAPPHGYNPSTTISFIMTLAHSAQLSEEHFQQIKYISQLYALHLYYTVSIK